MDYIGEFGGECHFGKKQLILCNSLFINQRIKIAIIELLILFPIPIPEVIEHHKENYEAEVAELEAAYQPPVVCQPRSKSSSSSEWSSASDDGDEEEEEEEDGSSSLYSDDLVGGDTGGMATPTALPINFDVEMDVEYTDDIYDSSDTESSVSSQYVLYMCYTHSWIALRTIISLSFSLSFSSSLSHTQTSSSS